MVDYLKLRKNKGSQCECEYRDQGGCCLEGPPSCLGELVNCHAVDGHLLGDARVGRQFDVAGIACHSGQEPGAHQPPGARERGIVESSHLCYQGLILQGCFRQVLFC